MSSAGSVRFQSLPDLTGDGEEIYSDPDRTSTGFLLLSSSSPSSPPRLFAPPTTTPPQHPATPTTATATATTAAAAKRHVKPATLPKPNTLRVVTTTNQRRSAPPSEMPPSPLPTGRDGNEEREGDDSSQCEDDYESPEVFKLDAQQRKLQVRRGGCASSRK